MNCLQFFSTEKSPLTHGLNYRSACDDIPTFFFIAVYLQKFCQYSPKTVFFEPVQVLYHISTAK